ncbi:MAG: hypothetical protein AMJ65_07170 [Phycisphaerae bacterium SG8_4]|nr:MAG: hypothetical protein AMJ65_07170 [Phycisphaerae bacterium SG8_4]
MFKQIALPQETWGAAETALVTRKLNDRGQVSQISFKGNNATNAITYELIIYDPLGGVLYTQSGIVDATTTVYHATKDSEDFHEFIVAPGCTYTLEPSGAPGVSTGIVDIILGMKE